MPTENEQFFTPERMRAIGLGIGRGFQAYDPDNPFAGAGAAIEGTIGAEMGQEERKKTREERLEDLKLLEDKQVAAENRAEEREIRSEDRQRENARKQRDDLLDWYRKMDVSSIDKGLRSRANPSKQKSFLQYALDFATAMIGGGKRIPGNAPIDPYADLRPGPAPGEFEDEDTFDPYRREIEASRKTPKPPESDAKKPLVNTPGARDTYIDRNGVKRYKDNDKPFGMF